MRRSQVANTFLIAGLGVGVVAGLSLAFGVVPSLSPFMLKVVIYKLAFLGAGTLLVAGAVLRRWARRDDGAASRDRSPVH